MIRKVYEKISNQWEAIYLGIKLTLIFIILLFINNIFKINNKYETYYIKLINFIICLLNNFTIIKIYYLTITKWFLLIFKNFIIFIYLFL